MSPVYTKEGGATEVDYYAIIICVPKAQLYHAVRQLRKVLLALQTFSLKSVSTISYANALGSTAFDCWLKKVSRSFLGSAALPKPSKRQIV